MINVYYFLRDNGFERCNDEVGAPPTNTIYYKISNMVIAMYTIGSLSVHIDGVLISSYHKNTGFDDFKLCVINYLRKQKIKKIIGNDKV